MTSTKLTMPSVTEREVEQALREHVLSVIGERQLTPADLAEALGITALGAEILVLRKEWPIEIGLRVADALEIPIGFHMNGNH